MLLTRARRFFCRRNAGHGQIKEQRYLYRLSGRARITPPWTFDISLTHTHTPHRMYACMCYISPPRTNSVSVLRQSTCAFRDNREYSRDLRLMRFVLHHCYSPLCDNIAGIIETERAFYREGNLRYYKAHRMESTIIFNDSARGLFLAFGRNHGIYVNRSTVYRINSFVAILVYSYHKFT